MFCNNINDIYEVIMPINNRIEKHTENVEKLMKREKIVESNLNNIKNKIIFHNTAIQNLKKKAKNV